MSSERLSMLIWVRELYGRLHRIFKILVWIVTFLGLGGIYELVDWYYEDKTVSVDIHPGSRCSRGGLKWMQDRTFIPDGWTLEGDAAELRICDNNTVSEQKPAFPVELAQTYPGCLHIDEESKTLSMQLNARAVCDDKENSNGYLCDGADEAAQMEPKNTSLVQVRAKLNDCTENFFEESSKPK